MSKITDYAFLFQNSSGKSAFNPIGSFQLSQLNSSAVQSQLKAAGINTNSKQYKTVISKMMQNANGMMYTNPAAIKNLMKNYDKDGDYISPATGLAGMDATDIPISQRHVIIDIPEKSRQEMFDKLPEEYSHLYLAIEDKLAAVICIEDPVRPEAKEVISSLKALGISKIVMMTGDSERTAKAIAGKVGVDEYYSEVLPEDKASFVENEKAAGRKVIMIGDGINDSPALSAADVGIAISDGAQIAREIADITVSADDLGQIVYLKDLSNNLIRKINRNYRTIVSFNSGLIALGVLGVIQPTISALLHNTSTLFISMNSMKNIPLAEEQK